jgi:hypothetical protein
VTFGESPVRALLKFPVPPLSVVFQFAVVGFGVKLQQIPFTVTVFPKSLFALPPPVAEDFVMAEMAVVPDTVGGCD